jgi:hypothetical protein
MIDVNGERIGLSEVVKPIFTPDISHSLAVNTLLFSNYNHQLKQFYR